MRPAPEHLTTDRLVLSRPRPADVPALFAYASDPDVVRYLSWPRHVSIENTHAFVEWSDREWRAHGVGPYVIRVASGALIGSTGVQIQDDRVAMTGYVLERGSWGQGYASEALTAMVALACSLDMKELIAYCHPDHRASIRVLEKAGFVHDEARDTLTVFPNLAPGLEQPALAFRRQL